MKTCRKCRLVKPKTEFYVACSICKKCSALRMAAYRKANSDKIKEYHAAYRARNDQKIEAYRAKNREGRD